MTIEERTISLDEPFLTPPASSAQPPFTCGAPATQFYTEELPNVPLLHTPRPLSATFREPRNCLIPM